MSILALEFLVTNILFSLILGAVFLRLDKTKTLRTGEFLLYALGLGPMITSLLLYYLLLFLPRRSDLFYAVFIGLIYLLLAVLGRRNFLVIRGGFGLKVKETKAGFHRLSPSNKIGWLAFIAVLGIFLAVFFYFYFDHTLKLPLDETDALKYGTLGKVLYQEKSMAFRWIRTYPKTGFYQIINHAPAYSLLLTWEKIWNGVFHVNQDLYFKSINAYYALLLWGVFVFWLAKRSRALALTGSLALFSGFSFFYTLAQQNLDALRVFFLGLSWIFLVYAVEKKAEFPMYALGIFSGLAAYAHTIGAVLVIFNVVVFFIFMKQPWKLKIRKTAILIALIMVFGWFHYLLDIFWGFGWVIFKRIATYWG